MKIHQRRFYQTQRTLHLIVGCNLSHTDVMLMRAENRQGNEGCHSVARVQPFQNTPSGTSFTTAMGPEQLHGLGTGKSSRSCNSSTSLKQQSIGTTSNKHCGGLRFTRPRLDRRHFHELQFPKLHTQWIFIHRHTIPV